LPKAKRATALPSLEILQAQIDLSKSWNHSRIATPPGRNLVSQENGFFPLVVAAATISQHWYVPRRGTKTSYCYDLALEGG